MEFNNEHMNNNQLDDLTFYSLLSVLQGGMWLLNDIESFLHPYGLSHGRFSLLLAIRGCHGESSIPIDMAKMLGKSKPTITKMLKKLENEKLVRSENEPGDLRKKRLILTKKSSDLLNTIIPKYNIRLMQMAIALNHNEKVSLMQLISKINYLDPDKKITILK